MGQIVATCRKLDVRVGNPHVTVRNLERLLHEGYSFLMAAPQRSYGAASAGRELAAC